MQELSIAVSFVAGLVSFLSPCVLPIVPGFLAYLAGSSLQDTKKRGSDIFLASLFFVLGFSSVFAALGLMLNTVLERVAYDVQEWLSRIGGTIIILFGLYLLGILKLPFLERTRQIPITRKFNSRIATSFVFGAAFAAGWTPCVGAVLGGILGLAATAPRSAFWLLFSYSLGLGLPFLLVGIFASRASSAIVRWAPLFRSISMVFGAVLVLLGILAFTQTLSRVANLELLNRFLLQ